MCIQKEEANVMNDGQFTFTGYFIGEYKRPLSFECSTKLYTKQKISFKEIIKRFEAIILQKGDDKK